MRILHTVEQYPPSVGGAQEVVRQLSERLVARGHEVTVATGAVPGRPSTVNGVAIEEFEVAGNALRGYEGDVSSYRSFLREGAFDVMLNYAAQQWATDLALPVLGELPFARVLAPCGFSALYRPEYAAYFRELASALADYDAAAVHSESYRDAAFVRAHSSIRVALLPNGAGADEFGELRPGMFRRRHGIDPRTPLLLTVGSHSGMKGHDLVIEAVNRSRMPRGVLAIVGNVPRHAGCLPACRRAARRVTWRSLGRKRVRLLDLPRPQVLEAFADADLFLLASTVECSPLVLFEAAASGTPFLTLPAGNAAEIASWTRGGVVFDAPADADGYLHGDPDKLATAIDELLERPERLQALGETGRKSWWERFRWEEIVTRYEGVYAAAVADRTAARGAATGG